MLLNHNIIYQLRHILDHVLISLGSFILCLVLTSLFFDLGILSRPLSQFGVTVQHLLDRELEFALLLSFALTLRDP